MKKSVKFKINDLAIYRKDSIKPPGGSFVRDAFAGGRGLIPKGLITSTGPGVCEAKYDILIFAL